MHCDKKTGEQLKPFDLVYYITGEEYLLIALYQDNPLKIYHRKKLMVLPSLTQFAKTNDDPPPVFKSKSGIQAYMEGHRYLD